MRVFITGITGTLGTALADLHHGRGDEVLGCARNEDRVVGWLRERRWGTVLVGCASNVSHPETYVGRLLPTVDRVYHCAAMKHVDVCERQPTEAAYQNVYVTQCVAEACRHHGVPVVLASSDKACQPTGAYGASKLLAEKVMLAAGGRVVRLVNLIGSSGSVFQLWANAVCRHEAIELTDPDMTRYFMTVSDAVKLMAVVGGNPASSLPGLMLSAKSVRMGDVASRMSMGKGVKVVGRRPGETQHQWLAAPGEFPALRDGLCSATADRWELSLLLEAAGVH